MINPGYSDIAQRFAESGERRCPHNNKTPPPATDDGVPGKSEPEYGPYFRSKRSALITLSQAATKSRTKRASPSAEP